MNFGRIALASVAGTVAYFMTGFAMFMLVPQLVNEGRKHAALFRSPEEQMSRMPAIMLAIFVAILVLAVLYARSSRPAGIAEGVRFGVLIGVFVVCAFVVHNYVNFNMGTTLMLLQAGAYFIEWTVVGTVIGLLYRPASAGTM
ncbi:MAG: DUF1761 family protein [Gemmatimonadota bacterium]